MVMEENRGESPLHLQIAHLQHKNIEKNVYHHIFTTYIIYIMYIHIKVYCRS